MKGHAIKYSAEELAWIEANKYLPRRDLHAAFRDRFDRQDVSQTNLTALCKRRGWLTGRTGQFRKGQEPVNKGKKGLRIPGSEKGWFKKGHPPANRLPLWSERVGKDGYIEMKVPGENPYTGHKTRFMHKHRYLWEQVNGPLPEGHALKCLDGDRTNTDPSNWEAIPRALLPRLCGGRWHKPYDAYEPETRPLVLTTAKLEHAAREAKKG